MELRSIGINHTHGRDFRITRSEGCGTWLLLLAKTPSFMVVEGERRLMPPDTLVLHTPGCPQDYGAVSERYADDWMHFHITPQDQELLARHPLPLDNPFVLPDPQEVSDLLRKLCYEFHALRPYREERMDAWFKLLVLAIHQRSQGIRELPEGTSVPHGDQLLALRGNIQSGACLDQDVDAMAREFYMSRSNLQHLYRRCFGTTIREDQLEARLSMARHYLASTSLPVAEIARYCGYRSESHFMTVFKERVGKTPGQYRATL